MTLQNILESPELRHTLAALPDDPQLTDLLKAHAAQAARLAVAQARPVDIDARIAGIDRDLVDADDKARRALLTERSLLREERDTLPVRLCEEGKRTATAELAVLGHLTARIRPFGEAAARELGPIESRANYMHARITTVESSLLDRASKEDRTTTYRGELAEAAPQVRALNERIRLVEYGLASIRGYVVQRFGAGVEPQNPNTYGAAAEAYARRVVRAAGVA